MRALPYSSSFFGLWLCASPVNAFELNSLEWPPYTGAALPEQGQLSSLLREALAQQDIPLKIRFCRGTGPSKPPSPARRRLATFPSIRPQTRPVSIQTAWAPADWAWLIAAANHSIGSN